MQGGNITELVQQSVGKVGRFFKVNYTLNYSTKDHCEEEIIIVCTIGSSYMNIQNVSQICPGKCISDFTYGMLKV